MFDWVQVRLLAGPLKDIQRLVPKPLLRCRWQWQEEGSEEGWGGGNVLGFLECLHREHSETAVRRVGETDILGEMLYCSPSPHYYWGIKSKKVAGCVSVFGAVLKHTHTTGGWWYLNWGGRACGNGWSQISGMVSNTWFPCVLCHSICSIPDVIRSCPPLSSLLWYTHIHMGALQQTPTHIHGEAQYFKHAHNQPL